ILVLFIHVIVTLVRVSTLRGSRSVVAESVLLRHQLLILNRGRKRSPNLRVYDRSSLVFALFSCVRHRFSNPRSSSSHLLHCASTKCWSNENTALCFRRNAEASRVRRDRGRSSQTPSLK